MNFKCNDKVESYFCIQHTKADIYLNQQQAFLVNECSHLSDHTIVNFALI